MVSVAIAEFDLGTVAVNPFKGLEIAGTTDAPETEGDNRDPLPADVIRAMRTRVEANVKLPEIRLIWRLLEKTGCRMSEIVGLRLEDVVLDCVFPHIKVQWHEERRVKTAVSIRSVPLVGDALVAAKEAVRLAGEGPGLFPRYFGKERGADSVSRALMKHLRVITDNPRHVNHSLRHNMKDWLVLAGIPDREEKRNLGHSLENVGDRVYGGEEAKLKMATGAMIRALEFAP